MTISEKVFSSAKKVVRKLVKVRPHENVLIISDADHKDVYEALSAVCVDSEIFPNVHIIPESMRPLTKMPGLLKEALTKANVVFSVVNDSIEEQATNRAIVQTAIKFGARVAYMPNLNISAFETDIFDINYAQVADRTNRLANIFQGVDEVKITNNSGTNITFEPSDTIHENGGYLLEPGKFANLPGGEITLEPVIDTVNGTIMVDGPITGKGILAKSGKVVVEKGNVVSVSESLSFLREYFEKDEFTRKMSKFAVGTNHGVELCSSIGICRKVLGTCNFGLGNSSYFGGSVISKYQFDLVLKQPTIELDGRPIVEEGNYVVSN